MGFSPWITDLPFGGMCFLDGRDKALFIRFFSPISLYAFQLSKTRLFAHCFLFACPKQLYHFLRLCPWNKKRNILKSGNDQYVRQQASANKSGKNSLLWACLGCLLWYPPPSLPSNSWRRWWDALYHLWLYPGAIKLALKASWGFPWWREILSGKEPT